MKAHFMLPYKLFFFFDWNLHDLTIKAGTSSIVGVWWSSIPAYLCSFLSSRTLFTRMTLLFQNTKVIFGQNTQSATEGDAQEPPTASTWTKVFMNKSDFTTKREAEACKPAAGGQDSCPLLNSYTPQRGLPWHLQERHASNDFWERWLH